MPLSHTNKKYFEKILPAEGFDITRKREKMEEVDQYGPMVKMAQKKKGKTFKKIVGRKLPPLVLKPGKKRERVKWRCCTFSSMVGGKSVFQKKRKKKGKETIFSKLS